MTNPEDKCPLCGEQLLSLACPGGCFTATAHEVDGLACKLRQLAKAKTEIDRLNKERDEAQELHDTAIATLLRELGADDSEPRTKWVSLAIANLKRERIEAQAAYVAMRAAVEPAMIELDHIASAACCCDQSVGVTCVACACQAAVNTIRKWYEAPNPGQPRRTGHDDQAVLEAGKKD